MRKRKTHDLLTEVELEFMSLLWELGDSNVRDILSNMQEDRNLAYTSAATIMRILEQKGFISSQKAGKTLIYSAILSKSEYQSRLLKDVSAKLFDNTPAALVATLVNDDHLTQDALEELRALLGRKLGDDSS